MSLRLQGKSMWIAALKASFSQLPAHTLIQFLSQSIPAFCIFPNHVYENIRYSFDSASTAPLICRWILVKWSAFPSFKLASNINSLKILFADSQQSFCRISYSLVKSYQLYPVILFHRSVCGAGTILEKQWMVFVPPVDHLTMRIRMLSLLLTDKSKYHSDYSHFCWAHLLIPFLPLEIITVLNLIYHFFFCLSINRLLVSTNEKLFLFITPEQSLFLLTICASLLLYLLTATAITSSWWEMWIDTDFRVGSLLSTLLTDIMLTKFLAANLMLQISLIFNHFQFIYMFYYRL